MIRVGFEEMLELLNNLFRKYDFPASRARLCAERITENSFDGIISHGVFMVPWLIERVGRGSIDTSVDPRPVGSLGVIEQWDGRGGLGIYNAVRATERALEIAGEFGIGCLALKNTNHWFRAGSYGWQAVRSGAGLIAWTNTKSNMPVWGAVEKSVGNNPLVVAVPHPSTPIVLDISMSQFALGKLRLHARSNSELPVPGGYNDKQELISDPGEILESGRLLPIGFWKGSGLAIVLDALAAVLSGGLSTAVLDGQEEERNVSQVFIAFNLAGFDPPSVHGQVERILGHLHSARPVNPSQGIRHPGQRVLELRERNRRDGLSLDDEIWEAVLRLYRGA
jgi:3-dehydro-L-gulonate 2-dehydrogenase